MKIEIEIKENGDIYYKDFWVSFFNKECCFGSALNEKFDTIQQMIDFIDYKTEEYRKHQEELYDLKNSMY